MNKTHALGIDLGTSNCAMALNTEGKAEPMDILQIIDPGKIGEEKGFPSALYIPSANQFPTQSTRLPWMGHDPDFVLGELARSAGAKTPDRLVSSAKSWLSYRSIDPTRPILPWRSEIDRKMSPLDASRRYLEHLWNAFKQETAEREDGVVPETTKVVLTVPASFDEVARSLTFRAASEAGLPEDTILLEEPQAAFYAWLDTAGNDWRSHIAAGDIVLVCDVGGGTTDFSLVAVSEQSGNLELERISVGRHILLGGDNMDLALAYALREEIEESGTSLDDWQFIALIHAVRKGKERLFERDDLDEVPISIPSRGAGLFEGTVSAKLSRLKVESIIIDGFFAVTASDDFPEERAGAGLRELGLPYAADAVISKHLAAFLTRSMQNVKSSETLYAAVGSREGRLDGGFLRPDVVLFNGGVFKARQLRDRVIELLQGWSPGQTVRELSGTDPDLAVSRGASVYGYHHVHGTGVRIRAGASRSYYVGLDASAPAIPGFRPAIKAVCVVPQGMEEGSEKILEEQEFGLATGKSVQFRFFSSSNRAGDSMGDVVKNAEKSLEETAKLETTLATLSKEGEERGESTVVPVTLHVKLNELGTLELWMQHTESDRRWQLEFNVRTE